MVAAVQTIQHDTPNTIAVAAVDAAHRSDNEILPEHERQWPRTELAEALIRERYDGTSSTSRGIGQELHNFDGETYPSWRIQQIAQQLGLAETARDAIIQRVRAQEDRMGTERQRRQGERPGERPPVRDIGDAIAAVSHGESTPTRTLLREDLKAIAHEQHEQSDLPTCTQCGKRFAPWRHYRGRPIATSQCNDCMRASRSGVGGRRAEALDVPEPAVESAPEPAAEPATSSTTSPAPRRWVDVLPEPRYLVRADGPALPNPAAADAPDDELTFGDLPGSRMVFELLDLLPTNGQWQPRRRRKWFAALTAALDLLIDEPGEANEETTR